MTIGLINSADTPEHAELRREVRKLCDRFNEEYWQQRDLNCEYPEEFVATLTKAGYLSVLIPAEYGGLGLGITEAAIILEVRCCGTAATSRKSGICLKSPAATCVCRPFRSPNQKRVRTHRHHDLRGQRRRPLRRHRSQELDKPH